MPLFMFGSSVGGTTQVGRVMACADNAFSDGSLVAVDGLTWRQSRVLIRNVTIAQSGNYQFLHTIGNDVYIYVFGDKVGQLQLGGLATASCSGGQHGLSSLDRWYSNNRLAARKAPVRFTIAGDSIEGFLIGGQVSVADPENLLVQFDFTFAILPPKK